MIEPGWAGARQYGNRYIGARRGPRKHLIEIAIIVLVKSNRIMTLVYIQNWIIYYYYYYACSMNHIARNHGLWKFFSLRKLFAIPIPCYSSVMTLQIVKRMQYW